MVCKTMHSSSILLGTSNLLVISFSVINYVVSRGAPREWRNLFFFMPGFLCHELLKFLIHPADRESHYCIE